jgi:Helix-turn-helix domain
MTKYTTLSEELNKLPRERQELIEARTSQIRLEEITLRHLREKLGLSQSELAERLEVKQPAIAGTNPDFPCAAFSCFDGFVESSNLIFVMICAYTFSNSIIRCSG